MAPGLRTDNSAVLERPQSLEAGTRIDAVAGRSHWGIYLALLLIAASTYVIGIISPPSLADDVDSVQAQIALNMLKSGDWVTARLDGVSYLEKPPLIYWLIAGSYKVFGVHDWAARIAIVSFCVALVLLTAAFGVWAFGKRAGFFAGLCMATCVGLYLFTRILLRDVVLTFAIALSMWALLRITDDEEKNPRVWALVLAVSLAMGLMVKSLIGAVFPVAAGLIYLFLTKQLFSRQTWKRLHPLAVLAVIAVLTVPWHVLATLRNPPHFYFSMHSGPGEYHGFFWFFFINEQLLRFLGTRYPRDYSTVPVVFFWLFNLVWLFPWSVYFPAVARLSFRPVDRAGRARLLALCWIGFVMVFFTFSTTQEYYSMPCYPAMALLLGSAMTTDSKWIRRGTNILTVISGAAAVACIWILVVDRNLPTPGDIFNALSSNPSAYTLSLGHMEDITLQSFAYLRTPLLIAAIAFLIGAIGTFRAGAKRAFICATLMMLLFFQGARLALITFDPYLSSRPLATAIQHSPPGKLILDKHYYAYSSVVFYTGQPALLLNGRKLNLLYGSYEPGSPNVFIDDSQLQQLWSTAQRYYLVAGHTAVPRLEAAVGREKLNVVAQSGGKYVFTNIALPGSTLLPEGTRAEGPADVESRSMHNSHRLGALGRPLARYRSEIAPERTDSTKPAIRAQTRYILLGATFASNIANSSGYPSVRVAPAVRDAHSEARRRPQASRLCTSPEEDS